MDRWPGPADETSGSVQVALFSQQVSETSQSEGSDTITGGQGIIHGGFGAVDELFMIMGGVALFLAAVGLYGVMSFGVNRRIHEVGIRLALGADAGDVLSMMVRQGARQIAIGGLIGMVIAFSLLSYYPLENFIFAHPENGEYGILSDYDDHDQDHDH